MYVPMYEYTVCRRTCLCGGPCLCMHAKVRLWDLMLVTLWAKPVPGRYHSIW